MTVQRELISWRGAAGRRSRGKASGFILVSVLPSKYNGT